MANKKLLKTYHGIPKTPIDDNTVFYASMDGTTIAEVGGATDSVGVFKPAPTGLGFKLTTSKTLNSAFSLSNQFFCIDITFSLEDFKALPNTSALFDLLSSTSATSIRKSSSGLLHYVARSDIGTTDVFSILTSLASLSCKFVHIRFDVSGTGATAYLNGTKVLSLVGILPADIYTGLTLRTDITLLDISISNICRGTNFATLPQDFIEGNARIDNAFNEQREIYSDALTSEYKFETIKASGETKRQYTITQATAGVWKSGDTIKVKGIAGEVISGVIDIDTALAQVKELMGSTASSTNIVKVDDVSKFSINDIFGRYNPNDAGYFNGTFTVIAIDAINKTITFSSGGVFTFPVGLYLVEYTASTSSPLVKSTLGNVVGTWSNLGTNQATFTLGTNASLVSQDLSFDYSLNEVAGQGGIPEVLTSVLGGEYNGKKLVVNPTVHITDDFAGKISGSVVENGNISRHNGGSNNSAYTLLQTPSNVIMPENQNVYGYIKTLDTSCMGDSLANDKQVPQQLFSFNLIEIVERKYGKIPALDVAGKVAWLKANISKIACKWHGYGSCPSGNKAYLKIWTGTNWYNNGVTNTSSTPTFLYNGVGISDIQLDGFIHCLAYTDMASTTSPTLLVLSGHGLAVGDCIENVTKGNILSPVFAITPNAITLGVGITNQTSNDIINKYHFSVGNKVSINGTTDSTLVITAHGLSTGDYVKNQTRGWALRKVTVIDVNTFTLNTPITAQSSGDLFSFYPLLGQQTAEATVIPSTIYTDYISLDITLKTPTGYDVLAPENTRRDDGLSNMLLLRKETKEIRSLFGGVSGDSGIVSYGDYNPQQETLSTIEEVTILGELPNFLITDVSTSSAHLVSLLRAKYISSILKQNNNAYMCNFEIAELPMSAETRRVNLGKKVKINGTGLYDNYEVQSSTICKESNFIGAMAYLVSHNGALKLLVITKDSGSKKYIEINNSGVCMLIDLPNRPLAKMSDGRIISKLLETPLRNGVLTNTNTVYNTIANTNIINPITWGDLG